MRLEDVEDGELRPWLSTIGEVKIRDGKMQLVPSDEISKSRFANWMAEKPPMAIWRMGAAIATLEWLALEKVNLYIKHDLSEDDVRVKSIALAIAELKKFRADPELNSWIWEFRKAILRRLLIDAKRDETTGEQLSRYSTFYCDVCEMEGREPSIEAPS
jgi:hypothetical protein